MKSRKKFLSVLACTSMLAIGTVTIVPNFSRMAVQKVQAAKKSVKSRSYGIDVSTYQNSSVTSEAKAGAQFAIVKVSEGTSYRNPKAATQIASAKANNMFPMAYHFALFGANSATAKAEASYAVAAAKAFKLPKDSYIACDWESGDGNNVNGGKTPSANAIIAFMDRIKADGYQPLLYSGASLLNNNINTAAVTAKFPNSLWVASYATMGQINTPNFAYFPSMNGVAIWQFTDNWRGLNVDGNISLLPLAYGKTSSQAPKVKKVVTKKLVMHKAYVYTKKGVRKNKFYSAYHKIIVYGGVVTLNKKKYYRTGKNSYVKLINIDGKSRIIKHNAYVYTHTLKRVKVPKIKKGTAVATYGSAIRLNNKKYYRIQKNRYVKAKNFK